MKAKYSVCILIVFSIYRVCYIICIFDKKTLCVPRFRQRYHVGPFKVLDWQVANGKLQLDNINRCLIQYSKKYVLIQCFHFEFRTVEYVDFCALFICSYQIESIPACSLKYSGTNIASTNKKQPARREAGCWTNHTGISAAIERHLPSLLNRQNSKFEASVMG